MGNQTWLTKPCTEGILIGMFRWMGCISGFQTREQHVATEVHESRPEPCFLSKSPTRRVREATKHWQVGYAMHIWQRKLGRSPHRVAPFRNKEKTPGSPVEHGSFIRWLVGFNASLPMLAPSCSVCSASVSSTCVSEMLQVAQLWVVLPQTPAKFHTELRE